jgi:Tfp pilus assembly protein FimV
MWSDGCCADFKCATLLLWLSTISANTNVIWHWNWFCANDLPAPQEPAAAVVMAPAVAAAARTVAAVVVPPAVTAAATAPIATGKASAGDLKTMPSSRLQRTEKSARTAFRNMRAAQVDGQTVEEAQKQQVSNSSGDMVRYKLGDLAYRWTGH